MGKEKTSGRRHHSRWTVEEINYLQKHYHWRTAKSIGESLSRTDNTVRVMARKLGLANPQPPVWTEEELVLIRTNYSKGIAFVQSLLPNRSKYAIRTQACLMKVTNQCWSVKECRYLRMYHGRYSVRQIAACLSRSVQGVAAKIRELGLNKKPKSNTTRWTEQELEILHAHYGSPGWITHVQPLLPGRTKKAISQQKHRGTIKSFPAWKAVEIDILKKCYPLIGTAVAQQLPGRTVAAIKVQASRLGVVVHSRLTRQAWSQEDIILLGSNLSLPIKELVNIFPQRSISSLKYMRLKLKRNLS